MSHSKKAVHKIKLPLTNSEFTVHMKADSFVGTMAGLSHDLCACYEMNGFEMTLLV